MSNDRLRRLHDLFNAAVDLPIEERERWIEQQCAGDQDLLDELRELLSQVERTQDPLEAGVGPVLEQQRATGNLDPTGGDGIGLYQFASGEPHTSDLSSDEFCEQLSELDVLSGDDLVKWLESVQPPETREDPTALASQLVSEGKITPFQASVLLGGRSQQLLIDKYLILDLIDSGGMGMVFKAVHRTMKRVVALKMLPPARFSSPAAVKRFRREVEVAATLHHPNIVTAHDADESKGVHFLVMEYARGRDLFKRVQQDGPMSVEQAVDCILQAATGLQHAHEQGVIHRDIKPENLILAEDGTLKILDLGLVSIGKVIAPDGVVDSDSIAPNQLTQSDSLLGTVAYMAPEQAADSATADARSDIYSLGCTFYFLMTGETPYGSDPIRAISGHENSNIPSLRDERPDVSVAIEAIFNKMLAKDPLSRPQSMTELIAALKDCKLPSLRRGMSWKTEPERRADGPSDIGAANRDRAKRVAGLFGLAVAAIFVAILLVNWLLDRNAQLGDSRLASVHPDATTDDSGSDVRPPLSIAPCSADQARNHQQAWAKHLGVPVEYTNSLGMKFMLIPPGEFMMGAIDVERLMAKTAGDTVLLGRPKMHPHNTECESRPHFISGSMKSLNRIGWLCWT